MSDQKRYSDEILRDYAKGRLPEAESAALEEAARSDAALAAEIALVRGIVEAGRADAERPSSRELGWAQLSRAIDGEPRRSPSSLVPKQFSRWQAAAAAAAAVAIWSLVAIPFTARSGDEPPGFEMASAAPVHAYSAQATFVETAQEGAIREALLSVKAEIVGGPSALGVYVLAFKDAQALKRGVETLRARTDLVETVHADREPAGSKSSDDLRQALQQ
jgi:hypothetical protein